MLCTGVVQKHDGEIKVLYLLSCLNGHGGGFHYIIYVIIYKLFKRLYRLILREEAFNCFCVHVLFFGVCDKKANGIKSFYNTVQSRVCVQVIYVAHAGRHVVAAASQVGHFCKCL